MLKWAGAAYLAWLGVGLILKPRIAVRPGGAPAPRRGNWWLRGLLTNLLNPKVGVFYVSFLPQFVPAHVAAAPFIFLLAVIHAVLGLLWFAALIAGDDAAEALAAAAAVVRWLDRVDRRGVPGLRR